MSCLHLQWFNQHRRLSVFVVCTGTITAARPENGSCWRKALACRRRLRQPAKSSSASIRRRRIQLRLPDGHCWTSASSPTSVWGRSAPTVKLGVIFRKDGRLCATRRYFPSGHFCSWCWLCHCKVLLCVSSGAKKWSDTAVVAAEKVVGYSCALLKLT